GAAQGRSAASDRDVRAVLGWDCLRSISVLSAVALLSLPRPSAAQDWIEFASTADRFTLNFPGEPRIEDTTYTSEYGAVLPARVYRAETGPSKYPMMVVD